MKSNLQQQQKKYWWELSNETHKNESDNLIIVNNYFNPAKKKKVWIRQNNKWEEKETDEFGCIFYSGKIADSIKFKVDNREFELPITKQEEPFLARITIKENFKDLVFRTLLFNYIRIEDGTMFIDVAEGDRPMKRLYFRRLESKK